MLVKESTKTLNIACGHNIKMNVDNFTMQEVLTFFNMTAKTFSEFSDIPKKTIEGWKDKGISPLGKIALKNIIKVKTLEEEFTVKTKELQDKSDDFDRILEIQKKYLN